MFVNEEWRRKESEQIGSVFRFVMCAPKLRMRAMLKTYAQLHSNEVISVAHSKRNVRIGHFMCPLWPTPLFSKQTISEQRCSKSYLYPINEHIFMRHQLKLCFKKKNLVGLMWWYRQWHIFINVIHICICLNFLQTKKPAKQIRDGNWQLSVLWCE